MDIEMRDRPYRILLKYPSRSRPDWFKRTLTKWHDLADDPSRLHWLCSFDADDTTMSSEDITAFCQERGVEAHYGLSKNKVDAINRDVEKTAFDWDVIVVVSDDFEPTRSGWDTVIDNELTHTGAALWFHDGRHRRICTLPIIGRKAFDDVLGGVVYDPSFQSVYCDNWQTDILQRKGLLKYIDESVFVHKWGSNRDELLERNENRELWARDEKIYRERGGFTVWDG